MNNWIKCNGEDIDALINTTVLMSDGYEVFPGFYDSFHEWHFMYQEYCSVYDFEVAYYMPLPEPPSDVDEAGEKVMNKYAEALKNLADR